jgi:cell division control protein 6
LREMTLHSDPLEVIFDRFLASRVIFRNRDVLRHDFVPSRLPHREDELSRVAEILAPSLSGSRGSNVLVYGKTGTGKTASVKYVLARLTEKSQSIGSPFIGIYLNCRIAGTGYRILSQICNVQGVTVPFTGLATAELLQRLVTSMRSKGSCSVVVLDEVDALVKGFGDQILYELTRINELLGSARLTLVGISNDLSFKEYLDPRVLSSLSEEEVIFKPYTSPELRDILTERAAEGFVQGAASASAIDLCAALGAAEHGDARRALDLLRVAGEIAEREERQLVDDQCVRIAWKKIEEDRLYQVVKSLPLHSRLVLLGVIQALTKGQGSISSGECYTWYSTLCQGLGLEPLTHRRVSTLVNELEEAGILICRIINQGRYGRTKSIALSAPRPIIEKALSTDNLLENLISYKPRQM